jgi:amino acid transporter
MDKGLKPNALSFGSSLVIGVASAAPAYSLASALGTIAGIAGFATPGVMLLAFVPMLCVATAYFYLNRADPDCGTTFAWVTRTMGPYLGWMGGWTLTITNVLVMPSLAVIAGQYSFRLFGISDPSAAAVTLAGVGWIVLMTAICYLGIEISARTQQIMLGIELLALLLFSAFALWKVYWGGASPSVSPVAANWFNPAAAGSFDAIIQASLVAVFIYWGWDTTASVNEETENPETTPGRAAIVSTLLLVELYVLVTVSALAFAGPALLAQNKEDVFAPIGGAVLGAWLGKLLILAVLTSAAAATQTTILPAARTILSMAAAGAIPAPFADINPRYGTPGLATLAIGAISVTWYAGLTLLSQNVLEDSILAVGLPIALYYAMTALACVVRFRRTSRQSVRNFFLMAAIPLAGAAAMAYLFVKALMALAKSGTPAILGIGTPAAIGAGCILAGLVPLAVFRIASPGFFKRGLSNPTP